ncbi:unnamed protein product (macronuclear) [Paramecium tetraurelia]|uniref:Gustatory receptor n=1 Tax=Paramecium tetraurelia TaxID=5888 RepID=A0BTE7_PARTE|nr:uncharacterized protein GSPATT00032046001 [Paramecium tetraurelia]CAK61814.1 unnamed protein product [Paramecium tetraurelia]|eukprot:XP_001429212.1 hypothetical protein (macronuclear) [Paramecium tetraurelia strain d4-2]
MQRQLRNKQIGIVTKVAIAVHTFLLLILVVSVCLKWNEEFLMSILFGQAAWQQFVIETIHLRLNRFNYLEEQEQIRKRFGLSTQKHQESSLWYYRRKLLLPLIVMVLFFFTNQTYEDFQYCFISVQGLLQIYQGSTILIVGIKQHFEKNKDYYGDLESEGLIMKRNLMLRRSEVRAQKLKTLLNLLKKLYITINTIYFSISVLYEFYAIFNNIPPFDLLQFIFNFYQIPVPIYALVICQLHILLVILYFGNSIIQKKANRVKRLYEHVTKEQEKLQVEGGKYLSALTYLSLTIIIFLYYNSMTGIIQISSV